MLHWRIFCCFFPLFALVLANPLDIRQYLKPLLEEQLSALISKNVTIGELRGNLYNRIILNNVLINDASGQAAAIGRAEVNYDLKGIIWQKFDVVSNIRDIQVLDAQVLVRRDANARWNYALPVSPSAGAGKKTAHPRMRVNLVNSSLHYIDEKGWGQKLPRRYDQRALLNARLDIDNDRVTFSAEAALSQNVRLRLDGQTGDGYAIALRAQNIDLAEHGYYALSFTDYALHSGQADLTVRARAAARDISPNVEAVVHLRDVDFQPSDYLEQPLRGINGVAIWRRDRLQVNNLRASLQGAALTLNGSIYLSAAPALDLHTAVQGLDLQKKYSKYLDLGELSGQVSAQMYLQGPLSSLKGEGRLNVAGLRYAQTELGQLEAALNLQGGRGELWLQTPDKINGVIRFQGDPRQKLTASVELQTPALEFYRQEISGVSGTLVWSGKHLYMENALVTFNEYPLRITADYQIGGGYTLSVLGLAPDKNIRLSLALTGNARNDLSVRVDELTLDFADSPFVQEYFPDSAGRLNAAGKIFWRDKQLALSGVFQVDNLRYADLRISRLAGQLSADRDGFELIAGELEAAESSLQGNARVRIAAGQEPLWRRLEVSADATITVNLAAAYALASNAGAVYQDLLKRADYTGDGQIIPARLPDQPLYLETGDSVLSKFTEFIPVAALTGNRTLEVQGLLTGRAAFYSNKGELKVQQDLQLRNGVLQGQRAELIHLRADSDDAYRVSLNLDVSGLNVAGAHYNKLAAQMLFDNGSLYFQNFDLMRERRLASHILMGNFPLYGLWDERYRQDEIDLRLRLRAEDLVLFAPFVPNLSAVSSSGNITLALQGTLQKPLLSAPDLQLDGTSIGLDNDYFQEILIRRARAGLRDNELNIEDLEIVLRSYDQYTPPLHLSGAVRLLNWSLLEAEQLVLRGELELDDTRGRLNIRNLYDGEFDLRAAGLSGDLLIPLSPAAKSRLDKRIRDNEPLGPLLTGSLSFANGTLYLFKLETTPRANFEQNLAMQLDLELNIRNDLRVQSGSSLFLTGDFSSFLSQININLRDENPPIKISGSTNFARVDGRIFLADGYVGFLNRKFTLLDAREQEKYLLSHSQRRPQDNYLEFVVTERFALDPQITLVAQTTVYDTLPVTAAALPVSDDAELDAPQYVTTESDYLVFVDGSLFDLSSIAFEHYKKEGTAFVLDGEPYVLRDKETGRTIDQYRFQELTYAISPPFIKSAIALARGGNPQSLSDATRETLRDLTVAEINMLTRSLLKPAERAAAEWTGLYDVRIKRDLGQDAARLAKLDAAAVQSGTETVSNTEHWLELELVQELWRERIFFGIDTNIDRNLQTRNFNITVNSYKLTWKIVKNRLIDELSLNVGSELDVLQDEYIPTLSLELLYGF